VAISIAALVVSIWSVLASQRASRQAQWSAFHSSTLATLQQYRASYSHAACLLRVANVPGAAQKFAAFKSNLDNLVGSFNALSAANNARTEKFEALLDSSHISFNRLNDAVRNFKNDLSAAELQRVSAVCGSEG
jgi:type II secretory pathway pseudopilin PulG